MDGVKCKHCAAVGRRSGFSSYNVDRDRMEHALFNDQTRAYDVIAPCEDQGQVERFRGYARRGIVGVAECPRCALNLGKHRVVGAPGCDHRGEIAA